LDLQLKTRVLPIENLVDVVLALQNGDRDANWRFTEHIKIRKIIESRIRDYRRQYSWIPHEDFEDVEASLRPRLITIAKTINTDAGEGGIVSYFARRIKGEADQLLRHITGARQVKDKETGKTYLQEFAVQSTTVEYEYSSAASEPEDTDSNIDQEGQEQVLADLIRTTPEDSNDRIWLRCYLMRLAGRKWQDIAVENGYPASDVSWVSKNTQRYVNRIKDRLIHMGQHINYQIVAIYATDADVGLAVLDTANADATLTWHRDYVTYEDLDRVESKLSDVFRQFDPTYVVINELPVDNKAHVICMRYLSKREAFVESMDALPFLMRMDGLDDYLIKLSKKKLANTALRAYQMALIKKAFLDCVRQQRRDGSTLEGYQISAPEAIDPPGDSDDASGGDTGGDREPDPV
jgi:hypothetical protein